MASERERAVAKLERELKTERAALEEAQHRLSSRRAALDQREDDLNRPRPPTDEEIGRAEDLAERHQLVQQLDRELESRERALAAREAALVIDGGLAEQRGWELDGREMAQSKVERTFADREHEFELLFRERSKKLDDQDEAMRGREARLSEREAAMEELMAKRAKEQQLWDVTVLQRERDLTERDRGLDDRERAISRRERLAPAAPGERRSRDSETSLFRRRERTVEEPLPEPREEPAQEPEPVQVEAEAVVAESPPSFPIEEPLQPAYQYWNLAALRRLVEKRAADFPDRIDEWNAYLDLLVEHEVDGVLPPTFDAVITEVFDPILDARSA